MLYPNDGTGRLSRRFRNCPGCNNAANGDTVYQCTDCNRWFCEKCMDVSIDIKLFGIKGRCPRCGKCSNVDAYEYGKVDLNKPFCTHEFGSGCGCGSE